MKRKLTKTVSVILALAMLLSLVACGTKDNTDVDASNTDNAAANTDFVLNEDTSAPTVQESSDKGDSSITVAIVNDVGGFNPFVSAAFTDEIGVYMPLLWYAYGSGYEPAAISEYEVAEDGMSMTWHISEEIYTAEGVQVKAEDILWCLKSHVDGFNASWISKANFDLENCSVVDEFTIEMPLLARFQPFFLDAYPHIPITSQSAFEASEDSFYYSASGATGPYKVVSYDEGVEARLTKNEYYAGGYRTTNVDNIVLKVVSESAQRLIMIESGEADVILEPNTNDISYIKTVDGLNLGSGYSGLFLYLAYNVVADTPLKDARVRQAIAYAIDNESMINSIFGDLRTPATSIISPTAQEWELPEVAEDAETNIYSYNIEKAKELLKEAGYENGFDIEISYNTGDNARESIAVVIQAMLAKIGINVTLQSYDKTTFQTMVKGGNEGWELAIHATKEQDSVLFVYFEAYNKNTTSIGGWYNEEFQTILEDAVYTLDMEDSMKMTEIFNEECPAYAVCYNTSQYVYRDGVENFRANGSGKLFPGDWNYDYDTGDWLFD